MNVLPSFVSPGASGPAAGAAQHAGRGAVRPGRPPSRFWSFPPRRV